MSKIKTALITALAAAAIIGGAFATSYTAVFAETLETPTIEQPEETPSNDDTQPEISPVTPEDGSDGPTVDTDSQTLSEQIQDFLRGVYGDDYESYYAQILEHWGSIENFLLNASELVPEEYRYKATELITTINAYMGVAADGVLLLGIAIYAIFRYKRNKQISKDLTTLKNDDNQIETAQLAIMESQKAQSAALRELLPGTRFEGTVNGLAESDKKLDSAAEEVKRIVD